ncbi:MAG: DUF4065 domain-containing protein [Balneolaceae bacterium]|nr:DUF4065 domain-containing protein [Balneolaceae bacterium]
MDKFQLAQYIAAKYPNEVSPMKLQKLIYYCYAWQLVAGSKKFDAAFEAWTHGPVEPEIYKEYKDFGRKPVSVLKAPDLNEPLLDFIMDSYAVYSAIELSKTTHFESPWKKFKDTGEVIPDEELIAYYSQQVFAKNFPLGHSPVYYPPKTSSHYSFTFDMEKEYVPEFASLNDYLESFSKEKERLPGILKEYGLKN